MILRCLGVILRYAQAALIHYRETMLRSSIALIGQRTKKPKGSYIVVSCISSFSILKRFSNGGSIQRQNHGCKYCPERVRHLHPKN